MAGHLLGLSPGARNFVAALQRDAESFRNEHDDQRDHPDRDSVNGTWRA